MSRSDNLWAETIGKTVLLFFIGFGVALAALLALAIAAFSGAFRR